MVPGGAQVPWLRRVFQRGGGLIPGEAPRALTLPARSAAEPEVRMAVLNCYEDTLPNVGRLLGRALAGLDVTQAIIYGSQRLKAEYDKLTYLQKVELAMRLLTPP